MSGSGGDFGPVAPAAGAGAPFAVAGPSAVTLDAGRSGSASFTVSNVTGRPVRARVLVLPGAGADAAWFQVLGESERALPVAGTTVVDVAVKVPATAPAGAASFVLGAALEEAPDRVVSGPTVAFQVPEPGPRPFPWWIVIVAVVAVLVLAGGGILIWRLLNPGGQPTETASPTASATPEPAALVVSVDGLELVDEQGEPLSSVEFEDGRATRDFLGDALGSTPEGVRNDQGYPFTSYDWGEVSIVVVDGGGASFRATSAAVEGLAVRTTEGISVGSSTSAAINAGAEQVYYPGTAEIIPDELRLQVTPAPGTTSLSNGGEGIDFVLLFMQSDEVDQILAPSNDYSDL